VVGIEVAGESAAYDWEQIGDSNGFDHVTLFPGRDSSAVDRETLRATIHEALTDEAPDAVAVSGWGYPESLSALEWGAQHDVPVIVMSESSYRDHDRVWWREASKRRLVRCFGAGLVGGTLHRDYLERLGMSRDRIFFGYDVVDNAHFASGAARARRNEATRRAALELPERYVLASSRFVPKKNLPRLIEAFGQYRQAAPEDAWDLVLLGDGPERSAVVDAIEEHGVEKSVHLPGFKQYDELPAYYGLAGAFVHASTREEWGLVVNEAMAAGLPVLVSERCGCAPDLVVEGETGYTFDPHDTRALTDHLYEMAHGTYNRDDMGEASAEHIEAWVPEAFGRGLKQAVDAALADGPPAPSLIDEVLVRGLIYR
jgi:glycosyltransferase involved in cell wall biosynthesis